MKHLLPSCLLVSACTGSQAPVSLTGNDMTAALQAATRAAGVVLIIA